MTALEQQVAELKRALEDASQPKDWRSTVGMFSGDEVMKRITDEALKYREEDRRKARRQQQARKRRAKA